MHLERLFVWTIVFFSLFSQRRSLLVHITALQDICSSSLLSPLRRPLHCSTPRTEDDWGHLFLLFRQSSHFRKTAPAHEKSRFIILVNQNCPTGLCLFCENTVCVFFFLLFLISCIPKYYEIKMQKQINQLMDEQEWICSRQHFAVTC